MTNSLLGKVNSIYRMKQSPELSEKFFDNRSTIHYSVVQLPFGGTWVGAEDATEYLRRLNVTLEIKEMHYELENYDEALGTFTVKTTMQGQWRRSGKPTSFSERHFGKLRGNKIRRLTIVALDIDEMLDGYFTRAEKFFNTLMKSLLQHGVGEQTLELVADDFVYVRPPTRENPDTDDIIHAKERSGKQGFAQFFADLFGSVDLQFGNHKFLYGNEREAVVLFPFTRFKLRSTGVDVTGDDVACYDQFVFDDEGKLKTWVPHLSRTFTHSEFYGAVSAP